MHSSASSLKAGDNDSVTCLVPRSSGSAAICLARPSSLARQETKVGLEGTERVLGFVPFIQISYSARINVFPITLRSLLNFSPKLSSSSAKSRYLALDLLPPPHPAPQSAKHPLRLLYSGHEHRPGFYASSRHGLEHRLVYGPQQHRGLLVSGTVHLCLYFCPSSPEIPTILP
ncbi:hypothetical protein NP233_g10125 [Leucocoprinus birnbaumii]|uniref:Uncharacterized protein n=1 Tax=Leucocoprinus birnbaumii TaxID=56174 RepID=A0AAD5VPT7_9AGAR|nr:hypothetical protein NP233_g10125 [Leucocoprinus birnbaumii]